VTNMASATGKDPEGSDVTSPPDEETVIVRRDPKNPAVFLDMKWNVLE
jgi:hypothetical protein